MGYEIEISCSLRIPSFQKSAIIEKAKYWGCELNYTKYELEGRRRQIYDKRCIMTFVFPEAIFHQYTTQSLRDLFAHPFIRYIRARRGIYIECISTESGGFELLYASSKYLSMMSKAKAKEYREKQISKEKSNNTVATKDNDGENT